ncbi:MAG: OmpH family outer membrane protein [Deltaproteobacteria bacterium]|jgi:outer membrane protein|nr:OmpH family outer membrane protein [Deltaproteobacteria bacterium]
MKKVGILFLSWGLLMVFTSLTFAVEPLKIAYVDMQKALNYCEAGKEAKRQMTLEVEKMQKVFAGKQKELEKIKDDLEKRGSVLSENVRREKDREYQAKLRDLQRLQKDYEDDLRRKDREFTERILKNMEVIIKQMGEEGKYTVILEKNQPTILFISNSLDLTEEVIKRIDQKQK